MATSLIRAKPPLPPRSLPLPSYTSKPTPPPPLNFPPSSPSCPPCRSSRSVDPKSSNRPNPRCHYSPGPPPRQRLPLRLPPQYPRWHLYRRVASPIGRLRKKTSCGMASVRSGSVVDAKTRGRSSSSSTPNRKRTGMKFMTRHGRRM